MSGILRDVMVGREARALGRCPMASLALLLDSRHNGGDAVEDGLSLIGWSVSDGVLSHHDVAKVRRDDGT